ncbi:MAG: hypothetical protein CFE43_11675 [Burkholderiales bacterium PBB3]|nr:MAG: hypothetical protein CFE43_11675 [Burkholderiales bacterium PBB3]
MSDQPVRQHWVPRVYLRGFCSDPKDRKQIYVRDLASGTNFLSSIDRVAVKKHFYTLNRMSDSPSYAVENYLASIESEVAPVLTAVCESQELPIDHSALVVLSRFLATLFIRSRQGLQVVHGHREEVREAFVKGGAGQPPDYAAALLALDDEAMRELFARSVVVVGARISERLLGMNWRLLRATDAYFLTSENPMFAYHPTGERWGLETPGAHILCPISPILLLHLSTEPVIPGEGTFDMSHMGVKGLNGLILLNAEQFLFSDRPFDDVADLLDDRDVGVGRAFGPTGRRE